MFEVLRFPSFQTEARIHVNSCRRKHFNMFIQVFDVKSIKRFFQVGLFLKGVIRLNYVISI